MRSSYTKRDTFQSCQKKYHLRYNMGLSLKVKPKPLRMGDAYSKALEVGNAEVVRDYYEELIQACLTGESSYLIEDYITEARMIHALAETYLQHVTLDDVAREVPFNQTVGNETTIGYFDGIKYKDGNVILIENKLKTMFTQSDVDALPINSQLCSYVAALCEMEGLPLDNIQVRYEVALKPQIRQTKKETREMFLDRLRQVILDDPWKYHKVYDVEMVPHMVEQVAKSIKNVHLQISFQEAMSKVGHAAWAPNTNRCGDFGGCEFIKLCTARNQEEMEWAYQSFTERKSNESIDATTGTEESTGA